MAKYNFDDIKEVEYIKSTNYPTDSRANYDVPKSSTVICAHNRIVIAISKEVFVGQGVGRGCKHI